MPTLPDALAASIPLVDEQVVVNALIGTFDEGIPYPPPTQNVMPVAGDGTAATDPAAARCIGAGARMTATRGDHDNGMTAATLQPPLGAAGRPRCRLGRRPGRLAASAWATAAGARKAAGAGPHAALARRRSPTRRCRSGEYTGAFPFDHLVLVMQENHSFDNYLGMLPVSGQPQADGFTFNKAGEPVNWNPHRQRAHVRVPPVR